MMRVQVCRLHGLLCRKVPLSEGRVHQDNNSLECAYHGEGISLMFLKSVLHQCQPACTFSRTAICWSVLYAW